MRQISTVPITSFRWDLNFRRDRSKEQFHLRGWVGVLVGWRNGRRSSERWGKCRTDEIWDEQTRTVLFILRFAYWLQILRKHTSFFMVNIVVTIIRNFNHGLNWRSRELTIQVVWSRRSDQPALYSVAELALFEFCARKFYSSCKCQLYFTVVCLNKN